MMTVFRLLLPMEPRLAPLGRPTLMGPIGTVIGNLAVPYGGRQDARLEPKYIQNRVHAKTW
jgi:hypothetical protein